MGCGAGGGASAGGRVGTVPAEEGGASAWDVFFGDVGCGGFFSGGVAEERHLDLICYCLVDGAGRGVL